MFDLMAPMPRFLSAPALALSALRDVRTYSPHAALARLARKWAARGHGDAIAKLAALGPYRTHVAATDPADPLFFLSHRHYLITGLNRTERIAAALHHYRSEFLYFSDSYHAALAHGHLILWEETHHGVTYDIRLTPAQDVLYEGGVSLVLAVDGARVAVLSYAWLPAGLVGTTDAKPLITRKQLTQARAHQTAFNAAFDRATPGHLLLAAFESVAMACGYRDALGLTMARHPAARETIAAPMTAAYDSFWISLGGVPLPGPVPAALKFALPLSLTPLDDLSGSHRRRAIDRRAHLARIALQTADVIKPHLRPDQADRRR